MAKPTTTTSVTIEMTDAPGYLSHFEITRKGGSVIIQSVNKRGYAQAEAEIPARRFFGAVERLK